MNEPVVDEAVPESLAAVGEQPVEQALERAIERHVLDVRSFPRLGRYLAHLLPHHVHHLRTQPLYMHWRRRSVQNMRVSK